jgi:hypothetical protein
MHLQQPVIQESVIQQQMMMHPILYNTYINKPPNVTSFI